MVFRIFKNILLHIIRWLDIIIVVYLLVILLVSLVVLCFFSTFPLGTFLVFIRLLGHYDLLRIARFNYTFGLIYSSSFP